MNHTYFVKMFIGALVVASFFVAVSASAQSLSSAGCLSNMGLGVKSTGDEVSKLQLFLREQGFLRVAPTGYFGPLTEQAVIDFEASGLCKSAPQLTLLSLNTSIVVSPQTPIDVLWSSINYPADKNITITFRPAGVQPWVPSQNGSFAAVVKNDGQEVVTPNSLQEGEYYIRVLCTDAPHCLFDDSEALLTVVNPDSENTRTTISDQTQLASVLLGFQTLLTKFAELVR